MKTNQILPGLCAIAWVYMGARTFFVLLPIEPILAFWVVIAAVLLMLGEIDILLERSK